MEGYHRPKEVTQELTLVLNAALTGLPQQRLGQIISNALYPLHLDHDLHELFNLHDETFSGMLHQHLGCVPPTEADFEFTAVAMLEEALTLLDEFDRHATIEEGYAGSPFQTRIQEFLSDNGVRQ